MDVVLHVKGRLCDGRIRFLSQLLYDGILVTSVLVAKSKVDCEISESKIIQLSEELLEFLVSRDQFGASFVIAHTFVAVILGWFLALKWDLHVSRE